MQNKIIADMLGEIAAMLSIEETPSARFEVRAYQKAALTIGTLQEPIEDVYARGGAAALMELPGVGKGISKSVEEFIKTGHMEKYDMLKRKYPIDFRQLTAIEGLGARRAVALYRKLGVRNIGDLAKAVEGGKVMGLEGFGEKSQEALKKGIERVERSSGRMLLGEALPVGEELVKKLRGSGLVEQAVIAGSARRMRETVGDLDILAISKSPGEVMEFFAGLGDVEDIIGKGPTKTSVSLKIGINCDLRVIAPESFGAALQYFTGSKDHNVQVRTIAVKMGYKLNEYGLFDRRGRMLPARDEGEIYDRLGMQYLEPEMREGRGEVALAQQGKVKRLVQLQDLRGDLHTHTKETDGANSIEEMAEAAAKAGLGYIATTNHTKSLGIANGMDGAKFARYFARVDKLNAKLDGRLRIFKGAEVDILRNGTLDLDAKTLKGMECVVAAVHSHFKMDKDEMTKRIVRALDSGMVHIMAHPTGREMPDREPYHVDLGKVFEAAERNGVAMEINSFPSRLDLNDTNIMAASKFKIKFSIDTDAHRTSHFGFLRYGVGTAKRGWLTKERVLNAAGPEKIEGMLSS